MSHPWAARPDAMGLPGLFGIRARRTAGLPACLAALLVAILVACGAEGDDAGPRVGPEGDRILVLAASVLIVAMPELVRLFEEREGGEVDVVLGSSGNLAAQIEAGAPADLYLSANRAFVDRLEAGGHLVEGSRRSYAAGRLALVVPPGRPVPDGLSALSGEGFAVVALANPEHAPYGQAAREALESIGIWGALEPRLVYAENVAQVAQFVRTGNADAGILALGVVRGERSWTTQVIPAELHRPLFQEGAVVRAGSSPEGARAFLDLILAEEGQRILARYGFEPPRAPGAP